MQNDLPFKDTNGNKQLDSQDMIAQLKKESRDKSESPEKHKAQYAMLALSLDKISKNQAITDVAKPEEINDPSMAGVKYALELLKEFDTEFPQDISINPEDMDELSSYFIKVKVTDPKPETGKKQPSQKH